MGRDLQFKTLTLVFALVALVGISACAVAGSPSSSSDPAEPQGTEVPEAIDSDDDAVESEPTATPEPEEPAATDDEDDSESTSRANVPEQSQPSDDDDDAVDDEEIVPADPVRLLIDSIDVDAAFEYVGVDDQGNMDVPQEWENVAWYEPGTVPGDVGNSVIAGHYDSDTGPAVFYDLNDLEVGDEVRIITDEDEELVFEIYEIESVHVDDADTSKIFGDTDERNLNLITCEGVWDTSEGMYDHRLIVYSRLVED